ncbi:MAG: glutamate synthase [Coriobacteriia bacterium]|nr:glutamate synthase [Coriobacteriia bacterium]
MPASKQISARAMYFKELNEQIKATSGDLSIDDCCGQRFIASKRKEGTVTITGTPGNALGAYLDGGVIEVHGNVQDAVGDTMNDGQIIVHGNAGDALGYAMRGGKIFVRGNTGYRTGIHMKEYQDKQPAIVVGGKVGSFPGEYLAGGRIVILGIGIEGVPLGDFAGTGMHGGKILIRTDKEPTNLPAQVTVATATGDDLHEIAPLVAEFACSFDYDAKTLMAERFYVLKPNAKNPYKQLYTAN